MQLKAPYSAPFFCFEFLRLPILRRLALKALRTCAVYNRLLALYLKPAVPKLNPKSNALDGLALDLLWTCSGLALDLLWTCSGLALDVPWTCPEPESVNDDAWTSA